MDVEHVMNRPAQVMAPDASAAEAARRMRESNVGCIVVARHDKPEGLVTDRDLALRVVAEGRDPNALSLGEIMSPCPVFVYGGRDLGYAIQVMREQAVRRLPVVDGTNKLIGVVSLDDVVRRLAGELGAVAEAIDRELDASVGG